MERGMHQAIPGTRSRHGSISEADQEKERAIRGSMDPIRDMAPLEEYKPHYVPVVTDRLLGQRVIRQHGVDTRRLNATLDKLSQQQSVTDRQAERERRAVERELHALHDLTGPALHDPPTTARTARDTWDIGGPIRETAPRNTVGGGPTRDSTGARRIAVHSSSIKAAVGIENSSQNDRTLVHRSKSVR